MPLAAVPHYLPVEALKEASPGLRFGMYLMLWSVDRRTEQLLWGTADYIYEVRGQDRQERRVKQENKRGAIDRAGRLTVADVELMQALATRQQALAAPGLAAGSLACFEARAVAPFTTGLGNEHPLENGFAFLNPYGLPYLPGSGVKGVLLAAARELGWSDDDIDMLFGRAGEDGEDTGHRRGALSFWDVIPQVEGEELLVDVMTPHQTHYYAKNESPHDSGSLIPICFLTVPPKSGFVFHVACDLAHLQRHAADLAESGRWQRRLGQAFEHAFEWLGFGAKTAVGYGAMRRDVEAENKAAQAAAAAAQERQRQAERATLSAQQLPVRDFIEAMQKRHEQLRGKKTRVGESDYQLAQKLSALAKGDDWSPADRAAAADAIEQWTPQVVVIEIKELRKKLGLAQLLATP